MLRIRGVIGLFFLTLVVIGCRKGDDDPRISFRSRDKRLTGQWVVVRYYYYDGQKSGVNNSGDPDTFYWDLQKDGRWLENTAKWEKSRVAGKWAWTDESDLIENREVIILGYQDFVLLRPMSHFLEELRHKKIRSRFQFDGDPKRYFIYEWARKD